jgi:hypothetical protein
MSEFLRFMTASKFWIFNYFVEPILELLVKTQGDRIGRIFVHWVSLYFGQILFKLQK